jgi:pimeloyl-ACP methyl ester carboxylesterase
MKILIIVFLLVSCSTFAQKGTIFFVFGATGGCSDWKPTADLMEAKGYEVYRPTLIGLGERAHFADPKIDLCLHVTDVANVILFEKLENVVWVGYSYVGMVITRI